MMNALRLREGFTPELFRHSTGMPFETIAGQLQRLAAQGLLEMDDHWRPTRRGFQYLNELVAGFLPDQKSQTVARS